MQRGLILHDIVRGLIARQDEVAKIVAAETGKGYQAGYGETGGAIQCGYCTPGMILAAKALLDENPNPTEAEIRHYLQGNLCRCTGYEPIIDAILAAAQGGRRSA